MRLDKYLKVSRLIKRRTVANDACDTQRVTVNGREAKASYQVKVGDIVEIAFGNRQLRVRGLSEANSNKFRALLDTKPSATPTAIVSPPTQDGQVVTELKQHPRYLSEEEIQEVIIRYQEGVSANKLAEIYGCHKCTIRSALRRNGITVSHSIADKKLLVEKMILLRNQGYAMKEIAKMVGINYHTVLRYFREHGALPNSGMEDKHQSST